METTTWRWNEPQQENICLPPFSETGWDESTGRRQGKVYFLLISNIFRKQSSWNSFFSLKLLCQVWVEKTSWKPCLGGCGMEAGTHLFSLFTYFYRWGPKANSKAVACRQQEHFSLPIPFPSTNKISTEDTQLSQQCRCHQMSALFQSMNQSSVRASYPASPDKSAVTSEGTKHGEIPLSCLLQAPITHWDQQCWF